MASQIGEYISTTGISTWTDLSTIIDWFDSTGSFVEGKKYVIYNNSATSFRFISNKNTPEENRFGSFAPQGSKIYFSPEDDNKLYIKGNNFNLAISEV